MQVKPENQHYYVTLLGPDTPRPIGHPSPEGNQGSLGLGPLYEEGWCSAGQQNAGVCR